MLRLQDKPVKLLSQDLCEDWLTSVDQELSINPVLPDTETHVDRLLAAEYANLAQLQSDMEVLHERVHATLGNIMSLLKQKFSSCSSMQCVWNTAVNEVSPITNLLVAHFKHHKNLISGCREGDAQSPCSADPQDKTQEDKMPHGIQYDELDGNSATQDASPLPTQLASTTQTSAYPQHT